MSLNSHYLLDFVLFVFHSVAPLSAGLLTFRIWAYSTGRRTSLLLSRTTPFRRFLNVWLVTEAMFWVWCKFQERQSQKKPARGSIPRLTPLERRALFTRCLETCDDPRRFVESWFRSGHVFEDLKLENVREWLAWGLFHVGNYATDMTPEEREELEVLLGLLEARIKVNLLTDEKLKGREEKALLMKFSEEPVISTHRPLVMYGIIHFLLQELLSPMRLGRLGFTKVRCGTLLIWHRKAPASSVSPSHRRRHPIVLVHGLGVGPIAYEIFIRRIIEEVENPSSPIYGHPILLPELQAVSQRIAPPELHCDEFVAQMKAAVVMLGYEKMCLFGHSYGSFAVSWMARRAPEILACIGLLDPACVFLHQPNVLYSILYKSPTNPYERFMHFLIREELFFNAHARRNFYWYINVLFLEDVDTARKPTLVVLSEADQIVPVREINRYVHRYNAGERLAREVSPPKCEKGGEVDLLFLGESCDHGGFLWIKKHADAVLGGIKRVVERACVDGVSDDVVM